MESKELRRIARENLTGNWGNAVLAAFLAALLGGLVTGGFSIDLKLEDHELYSHTFETLRGYTRIAATIATGVNLVHFILVGVIRQGYAVYLLKQYDRRNPEPGTCSASLTALATASVWPFWKVCTSSCGRCCSSSPVLSKATAMQWHPLSCLKIPR